MQVNSTTNTNAAASLLGVAPDDTTARVPSQTLNQNDFLKLLIAQMTAQDPLNPQSNTDFAAQMAQFTALQQTQTMSSDITGLRGQQQLLQASEMIGRTVTVQADAQTTTTGLVQSVQIDPTSGAASIVVNGIPYYLNQVLSIAPTKAK